MPRIARFPRFRPHLPRILWVDDDRANHRALAKQISDAGLRIDDASATSDALAALRSRKFSAVISDLRRGQEATAGLELLSRMRESGIEVPCLIFTSPSSEAEHGAAATDRGAMVCTSGSVSLLRSLAAVLREGSTPPEKR